MKRRKPAAAACRTITADAKRVVRALEEATHGRINTSDPIMEQLRQCPEAFQAGELVGKMFDAFRYSHDEVGDERYLPPPGTVIPPLV